MKIAIVTDAWFPQVNGVVTTLNHVRIELEAMGHEPLMLTPQGFRTFPCPRYPEIRLSLLARRGVRRMLDEWKPHAIHIATEGPLGLAARTYCSRRRLRFTTGYHTQFPHYIRKYAGVPTAWTYAFLRWFHGRSGAMLVPTRSVQRELEEHGFRNARVWARGVDTAQFRPGDKSIFDYPRPVFVYVGRVAREKNIEAFLTLDLPGTKVVVGDGPARASVERRFPDVKFLGMKRGDELARCYAASDVFVFPSLTDTFGVVMLEALACGVPVAAFPVTGPIDVITDPRVGALDHDLKAACLKCLELDSAICREFALALSWRRVAEIFFDALELLEHAPPRRDRAAEVKPAPPVVNGHATAGSRPSGSPVSTTAAD